MESQQEPNFDIKVELTSDDLLRRIVKFKPGKSTRCLLEGLALKVLSLEVLEPYFKNLTSSANEKLISEYLIWKSTSLGPSLHVLDQKKPKNIFKRLWWELGCHGIQHRLYRRNLLHGERNNADHYLRSLSLALVAQGVDVNAILAADKAKNPKKWAYPSS